MVARLSVDSTRFFGGYLYRFPFPPIVFICHSHMLSHLQPLAILTYSGGSSVYLQPGALQDELWSLFSTFEVLFSSIGLSLAFSGH